jgi:FMN phosphatase YigB (HAD superfamily)
VLLEDTVTEKPKSRFELVVELIKATAWPVFAAVVLITFWGPLHDAAREIPTLIGRSDAVTIAGLSIKVGHGLREKASPDVRKVLAELSREGIEQILSVGSSSWWDKGAEASGRTAYAELLRLRLMEEVPAGEIETLNKKDGRNYGYAVRVIELGQKVRSFLQSVVAEFVQELARSAPDEK